MISFGGSDRGSGRRGPPDYTSRPVQLRLFVLVGALMLVLACMFEARKPENWRWLWAGHRSRPGRWRWPTARNAPSPRPQWRRGETGHDSGFAWRAADALRSIDRTQRGTGRGEGRHGVAPPPNKMLGFVS